MSSLIISLEAVNFYLRFIEQSCGDHFPNLNLFNNEVVNAKAWKSIAPEKSSRAALMERFF